MFKNRFESMFRELGSVSGLVTCALIVAVYVVLNFMSIYVLPEIKLTFAFLALAVLAVRFGPVIAALAGGAADVIAFYIRPMGSFAPGITLSVMLSAFVFGLFLYRTKLELWRIIVSRTIINVFLHTLLNTYWLSLLYGKGYFAMLHARALKNLVLLPIEIFLIFVVLKAYDRIIGRQNA
jgi:ECF transporter S component (folate family)